MALQLPFEFEVIDVLKLVHVLGRYLLLLQGSGREHGILSCFFSFCFFSLLLEPYLALDLPQGRLLLAPLLLLDRRLESTPTFSFVDLMYFQETQSCAIELITCW